jgi:alpha-mannosidase
MCDKMRIPVPTTLLAALPLVLSLAGGAVADQEAQQPTEDPSVQVPSLPAMVTPGGMLVPHADFNFQTDYERPEHIHQMIEQLKGALEIMSEDATATLALSSPGACEVVERYDPALFARIKRRLEQQRIQPVGGRWCEADALMISAESHARQLLYGQDYFQDTFGRPARVGWEPNTPGFPASMPQILRHAGIGQIYLRAPEVTDPVFWWQGLDDSKVLVINGVGVEPGFDLQYALPGEAFSNVLQAAPKPIAAHKGEITTEEDGRYTTRGDVKQLNRQAETALTTAEAIASIASMSGFTYPADDLRRLWQDVCWAQHYATLGGTCIGDSYDYTSVLLSTTIERTEWITRSALRHIAARIPYPNKSVERVVVANPLGWNRSGVVSVPAERGATRRSRYKVTRCDGRETAWQVIRLPDGARLFFWADDVPAYGYDTYQIEQLPSVESGKPHSSPEDLDSVSYEITDEGVVMENGWVRVIFDKESADIVSIIDHANGREVLTGGRRGNLFELHAERLQQHSAAVIGKIEEVIPATTRRDTTITDLGPLQVRVRIIRKCLDSLITQWIMLTAGSPQIDFETVINWREEGKPPRPSPMLRVAFPLAAEGAPTLRYSVPFGYAEHEADGSERPALTWASIPQEDGGTALLHTSKYGVSATSDGTVRLTLVRAPHDPDPKADQGYHRFTYSLLPLSSDATPAAITRAAMELNTPLVGRRLPVSPSPAVSESNEIPERFGAIEMQHLDLVVPTCLKRAEDDSGFVMRLYLDAPKPTVGLVTTNFPTLLVEEVNLLEGAIQEIPKEGRGQGAAFPIGLPGFGIQTYKLTTPQP